MSKPRITYAFIDHQNLSINVQKYRQEIHYGVLYEVLKNIYQVQKIFLFDCHYGSSMNTDILQKIQKYDFETEISTPLVYSDRIITNIDQQLLDKIRETKNEHTNTILATSDVGMIRTARRIVRNNTFLALVDNRTITYGISNIKTQALNQLDSVFKKQRIKQALKTQKNPNQTHGTDRRMIQQKKRELFLKYDKDIQRKEGFVLVWSRENKIALRHV